MQGLDDFMLIFRITPDPNYQPSDAERNAQQKQWATWIGSIATDAKLVSTSQLGFNGKNLTAAMTVEEGIYIAGNKAVGGNMIVKAVNLDDALQLAKGCPVLQMGGTIEIRNIIPLTL